MKDTGNARTTAAKLEDYGAKINTAGRPGDPSGLINPMNAKYEGMIDGGQTGADGPSNPGLTK